MLSKLSFAVFVIFVVSGTQTVVFAQIDAVWNGGTGDWFDSSNWSTDPVVPNGINPSADRFSVRIDNGSSLNSTVNIGTNQAVLVDSLHVDTGDLINVGSQSQLRILSRLFPHQSRNAGVIHLNDASLVIEDTELENSGGLITANGASQINIFATINGGTIRANDAAKTRIGGGKLANLTLEGNSEVNDGRSVFLEGTINNRGILDFQPGSNAIFESSIEFTGGGTIDLRGFPFAGGLTYKNEVAIGGATLTNVDNKIQVDESGNIGTVTTDPRSPVAIVNGANGSLVAQSEATLTIQGNQLTNYGRIHAGDDALIGFVGPLDNYGILQANPESEILSLSLDDTINHATGLLTGDGTLNNWTENHGTIAPGSSVGTLTVSPPTDQILTFGETSVLEIEIDATGSDLLAIFGDLMLDGALEIDLLSGFLPAVTDNYQIISVTDGSLLGTFDTVNSDDRVFTNDGTGSFRVQYLPDGVVLHSFVATVPEPAAGAFLLVGCGAALVRRRRSLA